MGKWTRSVEKWRKSVEKGIEVERKSVETREVYGPYYRVKKCAEQEREKSRVKGGTAEGSKVAPISSLASS